MNILRNKENLRCAIIVNDMASINIDGEVLSKGEVINREEELVEMQNGCICCCSGSWRYFIRHIL